MHTYGVLRHCCWEVVPGLFGDVEEPRNARPYPPGERAVAKAGVRIWTVIRCMSLDTRPETSGHRVVHSSPPKMDTFLRVLSRTKVLGLARFVGDNLNAFTLFRVARAMACNHVQLANFVLADLQGHRDAVFFDQHGGGKKRWSDPADCIVGVAQGTSTAHVVWFTVNW